MSIVVKSRNFVSMKLNDFPVLKRFLIKLIIGCNFEQEAFTGLVSSFQKKFF